MSNSEDSFLCRIVAFIDSVLNCQVHLNHAVNHRKHRIMDQRHKPASELKRSTSFDVARTVANPDGGVLLRRKEMKRSASENDLRNVFGYDGSTLRGEGNISSLYSTIGEAMPLGAVITPLAHSQLRREEMCQDVVNRPLSIADNKASRVTSSDVPDRNASKDVSSDSSSRELTQSAHSCDLRLQLIELDPQSEVVVLADRRLKINGQLKISPSKLATFEKADIKKIMEWTRKINQPSGDIDACDNELKKMSDKYYIQFEYNRRKVGELLKLLGVEHLKIFKEMDEIEKDRVLSAMVFPAVRPLNRIEPSGLQYQAVNYALSRNVSSVYDFVACYEFYTQYYIKQIKNTIELHKNKKDENSVNADVNNAKRDMGFTKEIIKTQQKKV